MADSMELAPGANNALVPQDMHKSMKSMAKNRGVMFDYVGQFLIRYPSPRQKKNLDASLEKEKVENKLHFFARRFYNHANGNVEATQPVRVESIN